MRFTWDSQKYATNLKKHGLAFELAEQMFGPAAFVTEGKPEGGEERWLIFHPIDGRLHVAVFTHREGTVRVISLRKANHSEKGRYEKAKQEAPRG